MATDKAIDTAIREYGTYPGKVWYIQGDGSLLPADGGAPLVQEKTCQHCKHLVKRYSYQPERCYNIKVYEMMDDHSGGFEPPADFGCTLWSSK